MSLLTKKRSSNLPIQAEELDGFTPNNCPVMNHGLSLQIHRHIESLERLQAQMDVLEEAIEEKTTTAHEKLSEYQTKKQEAEGLLDQVAEYHEGAIELLGQAGTLFSRLKVLKAEHLRLSSAVQRSEPDGPNEDLYRLREARGRLRTIYGEIQRLRADAAGSNLV